MMKYALEKSKLQMMMMMNEEKRKPNIFSLHNILFCFTTHQHQHAAHSLFSGNRWAER